jgi:hypothetical protein
MVRFLAPRFVCAKTVDAPFGAVDIDPPKLHSGRASSGMDRIGASQR